MNKKKKLKLYLACLSGVLSLTSCSSNDSKNETKNESEFIIEQNEETQYLSDRYPYFGMVVLDNDKALIYDIKGYQYYKTTAVSVIAHTLTEEKYINEEIVFPSQIIRIFPSHVKAEEYASLIIDDPSKIICINFPEHDLSNVEYKNQTRTKTK